MKALSARWFGELLIALLLLLAAGACFAWAQRADESLSGFRYLTAREAATKRVGYKACNMECSDTTRNCPKTKAMDICPTYTVDGQTECEFDLGKDSPKCFICEKALPFKICTNKNEVNCLQWEGVGPDCGKSKRPNCEWVGGKCRCKAMPPNFGTDPCPTKNCKPG